MMSRPLHQSWKNGISFNILLPDTLTTYSQVEIYSTETMFIKKHKPCNHFLNTYLYFRHVSVRFFIHIFKQVMYCVRFYVLTVMLPKIQVFWDVIQCQYASSYSIVWGSYCLHLQPSSLCLKCIACPPAPMLVIRWWSATSLNSI